MDRARKLDLYNDLRAETSSQYNWVWLSDFNAILGAHEKRGNIPSNRSCREF